jgi:hypothetical protein
MITLYKLEDLCILGHIYIYLPYTNTQPIYNQARLSTLNPKNHPRTSECELILVKARLDAFHLVVQYLQV